MRRFVLFLLMFLFVTSCISCSRKSAWAYILLEDSGAEPLAIVDSVQIFSTYSAKTTRTEAMQSASYQRDLQMTGFYVAAGSTLHIDVKTGKALARLAIANALGNTIGPVKQYIDLKKGKQSVSVGPNEGLVYFSFRESNDNSTENVEVKFGKGFIPVPYYREGITGRSQWMFTLDALRKIVPYVILRSDQTNLVARMDEMLLYKQGKTGDIIEKLGSSPQSVGL
ncbi:MAG: hypothetical protein LBF27_02315 [Sphingobacterium sp.]|nr:hypothetical protein [Sphingobacterium sp.]